MNRFKQILDDVNKDLRMWPTWELQTTSVSPNGKEYRTWDSLSPEDRVFNTFWNDLGLIVRDMSAAEVQQIVIFAEKLREENL